MSLLQGYVFLPQHAVPWAIAPPSGLRDETTLKTLQEELTARLGTLVE